MPGRTWVALAVGWAAGWAGASSVTAAPGESRAFIDAMVRNVGMIPVECPLDAAGTPGGGSRVCLGPYWSFKDFRKLWDDAAADARRVPSVARPLSTWETRADSFTRAYRLGDGTVQVVFDRKRESVVLLARPDVVATPAPPAPPAAAVAAVDGRVAEAQAPTGPANEGPTNAALDLEPVLIESSRVPPRYPAAARPLRLSATVVVNVIVGPDAKVEGVILDSCTQPGRGFEAAAVDAVSKWKFRAGRRNGEPVRSQTRVTLTFTP